MKDLSHIFLWLMHFGAVVPPEWCYVLFNAIRKNRMLICPVAGNVNFYYLVKMVSARFLNLIVNKYVVIVFCGETLWDYNIPFSSDFRVLACIDESYLTRILYSERYQMVIFLTCLFFLDLLVGIVQCGRAFPSDMFILLQNGDLIFLHGLWFVILFKLF